MRLERGGGIFKSTPNAFPHIVLIRKLTQHSGSQGGTPRQAMSASARNLTVLILISKYFFCLYFTDIFVFKGL